MIALKAKTIQHAIDCHALQPERLAGKSASEIADMTISLNLKVGDVFEVIETSNSTELRLLGTTANHTYIGFGLKTGQIIVEHDAGDFLGADMQGGVLICKGNAGERVGDSMRRGILLVDGNVGDYCASNFKAGTLGVLGNTGAHLGYGMKRGTLLLGQAPQAQATWIDCGLHSLPFLKLLYKSFAGLDSAFAKVNTLRVQRLMGDVAGLGKAEMLVLQAQK